jgi:dethiobiotin synthetase
VKHGFFVTGTGTGVGKTFVTAMLAAHARTTGRRVFAFKPIETGCNPLGEDQELLARAAGDWQQGELRNLYRFTRAIAPLAAAQAEDRAIDLDQVERVFQHGFAQADLALVEGAGGWRVPITEAEDMASLAVRLGLPVIVVGTAGLGTINHTLLTIEAIEREELRIATVVLSCRPEDDFAFAKANAAEIQRCAKTAVCVARETSSVSALWNSLNI